MPVYGPGGGAGKAISKLPRSSGCYYIVLYVVGVVSGSLPTHCLPGKEPHTTSHTALSVSLTTGELETYLTAGHVDVGVVTISRLGPD